MMMETELEVMRFLEWCRQKEHVACLFFQPDGGYVMFPVSAEIMAAKDSDATLGPMLMKLYRDGLADLANRKARKAKPQKTA